MPRTSLPRLSTVSNFYASSFSIHTHFFPLRISRLSPFYDTRPIEACFPTHVKSRRTYPIRTSRIARSTIRKWPTSFSPTWTIQITQMWSIKSIRREPPPFVTHYQSSEGVKYKLDNTLDHDGTTFHFCDCPLHRNKLKWHTHHPDKCHTRNCWLKDKGSPTLPSNVTAAASNISDKNRAYEGVNSQSSYDISASSSSNPTQNVQALPASAMNLVTDNDVVKDLICDALNASNDLWQLHQWIKLYF